jgi:hypothetical protein
MIKIAVYSCNFGNYRRELKNYSMLQCDDNIDYYLFTDNKTIQLNNWTIYHPDIIPSDDVMNGNRWTSKYIKFILPDILKSYDIIIWIDSKEIHNPHNITYKDIINLLERYPTTSVFNIKHPNRNTAQEELAITIKTKVENIISGRKFLNLIKNFKSEFFLPDTCFIIRKNTKEINDIFEYCFELLKIYKLKRDQNIYNYAFHEKNIIPLVLDNFKL